MNNQDDEKLQQLFRRAIPPVTYQELKRDLWPEMLRKLDEETIRVPWFDWVLTAVAVVSFVFIPGLIPVIFYLL